MHHLGNTTLGSPVNDEHFRCIACFSIRIHLLPMCLSTWPTAALKVLAFFCLFVAALPCKLTGPPWLWTMKQSPTKLVSAWESCSVFHSKPISKGHESLIPTVVCTCFPFFNTVSARTFFFNNNLHFVDSQRFFVLVAIWKQVPIFFRFCLKMTCNSYCWNCLLSAIAYVCAPISTLRSYRCIFGVVTCSHQSFLENTWYILCWLC